MLAIGTKPSGLHCSYRWGINDGNRLNNFLLVRLRAGSVEVTNDGGHTSLVAHGGGQVDGLLGVILGEAVESIDQPLSSRIGDAKKAQKIFSSSTYDLTFPR